MGALTDRLRHDGSLDDDTVVAAYDLRYLRGVADEIDRQAERIAHLESALSAATTAVQIYGDQLLIDQLTALGAWPEQVEEANRRALEANE